MAKVTLMPAIESISGKIGNVVFRTYKNGQTRVYSSDRSPRKTKVTKKETQQREFFARACADWKVMPQIIRNHWQSEYRFNDRIYNGKKYATLRGYFLAKKMAELKVESQKPKDERQEMRAPEQPKDNGVRVEILMSWLRRDHNGSISQ